MREVGLVRASPAPEKTPNGGLPALSQPYATDSSQLPKHVFAQNPKMAEAVSCTTPLEESTTYELLRLFDEVGAHGSVSEEPFEFFPGTLASNDQEEDGRSLAIVVHPEIPSVSEKDSLSPSPAGVIVGEELVVTDGVSDPVLSFGIENSDWVLSLVYFVRQVVGVSCEGHEDKLMSLFASLERE